MAEPDVEKDSTDNAPDPDVVANAGSGISKGGAIGLSTDGFSKTPGALGPNVRGGGVDVGIGSEILIAPTKPVTTGPADGLTGQPVSVGDGAGVGAGSIPVPAPIKPASAEHEGALTDQPMNAAALALFARVTELESDIRAAREAKQDQAALHGRLWVELEAAEATVEAVSVPPATPRGASAAVRRRMREDERSRLRRTLVAACRSHLNQCERHRGRLVRTLRRLAGELAAAEAAARAAARDDEGAAIATFPTPLPRKTVSVDDTNVFIPSGGAPQLPISAVAAGEHEMDIAFGSFGENDEDSPVVQNSVLDVGETKVPAARAAEEARAAESGRAPAAEAKERATARRATASKAKPKCASAAARRAAESNPVPPGAASGARAAAALPPQGPEPVTEDGCPMCGSPFFDCESFDRECRFGLGGRPSNGRSLCLV